MRCDSFLDEDREDCPETPNGEHRCMFEAKLSSADPTNTHGHRQAHECECGKGW